MSRDPGGKWIQTRYNIGFLSWFEELGPESGKDSKWAPNDVTNLIGLLFHALRQTSFENSKGSTDMFMPLTFIHRYNLICLYGLQVAAKAGEEVDEEAAYLENMVSISRPAVEGTE